jgi:hypothetical protein
MKWRRPIDPGLLLEYANNGQLRRGDEHGVTRGIEQRRTRPARHSGATGQRELLLTQVLCIALDSRCTKLGCEADSPSTRRIDRHVDNTIQVRWVIDRFILQQHDSRSPELANRVNGLEHDILTSARLGAFAIASAGIVWGEDATARLERCAYASNFSIIVRP